MPPSDRLITASVAQSDGIVVLGISGQIDVSSEATFETVVDSVLADKPAGLILDLSAVEFLGSAGLRILAIAQEKLAALAVVANTPVVTKPIQLTGLDRILMLRPSVQDALADLRTHMKPAVSVESVVIKPEDGDGAASGIVFVAPEQ